MALDFSGYVPGMVNIGPAYKPPTVTQEIISLRAMIENLRKQIGNMDPGEIEQLRTDLDTLQVTVNNITVNITEMTGDLAALQEAVSGLDGDIEQIRSDLDTLDGDLGRLDETVGGHGTDIANLHDDIGALETAIGGKADANTDGAAVQAAGIPYGECDSTSTATVFTATVPGITELKNGVIMLLKNGVVTSAANFTIEINGLGAKPAYSNMAAATRETTLFNVAYTMLFIYDEDRVSGGCWVLYRGYDANTNTIGYQLRTNSSRWVMANNMYRYRLMFESADGTQMVSANTSTSTNATSARTPTTLPINPFGAIIYYGYTTAITAGSMPAAAYMWTRYVVSIGYSFTPVAMTAWKPLYLKCTPQADGSAVIDPTTPYTQDLPASADGKIYIYLGQAISTTQFELVDRHPVYYFAKGIRRWTGTEGIELLSSSWDISGSLSTAALNQVVENFSELEITVNGPYSGTVSGNTVYMYRNYRVPVSAGGFVIRDFTAGAVNNIIAIGWSGTTLSEQNMSSPLTPGYTIERIIGY